MAPESVVEFGIGVVIERWLRVFQDNLANE
jgi:hypothetical protein